MEKLQSVFDRDRSHDFEYKVELAREQGESFNKLIITRYMGTSTDIEIPALIPVETMQGTHELLSVREIDNGAFNSLSIGKLVLPNTLETVCEEAFLNTQIKEIVVNGEDTYLNSNIQFKEGLKPRILGHFGSVAERFAVLKGLEFVTLDPYYHRYDHLFDHKYGKLSLLEECDNIIIPYVFQGEKVEVIAEHGFKDRGVRSLHLPHTIIRIEEYAFSRNELTEVVIPENVKYLGDYAFIENRVRPTSSTVTWSKEQIRNSRLNKVVILNRDVVIGEGCFKGNPDLTIHGYKDSSAERHASQNRIPFKEIPTTKERMIGRSNIFSK